MIYEDFKAELIDALSTYFDCNYEISIQNIQKNNETTEEAIIIREKGRNISPTIYLKPYYLLVKENSETIKDIADNIRCLYYNSQPLDDFDLDQLFDFNQVSTNIVFKLVNLDKNKSRLDKMPHRMYMDLAIIYEIIINKKMLSFAAFEETNDSSATITITNELMDKWKISETDLFNIAKKNTARLNPPVVKSLMEFCKTLMSEIDSETICEYESLPPEMDAYILTNNSGRNGATAMLYKNQLKFLSDIMNDNLVIIPSSIHEVIIFRKGEKNDITEWNSIIELVNSTELAECDILSTHAYFFDRKSNILY